MEATLSVSYCGPLPGPHPPRSGGRALTLNYGRLTISAIALAAVAAAAPGTGAHAAVAQAGSSATSSGHTVHFVLPKHAVAKAAAASNNLVYSGGPVEAAGSTNYAIFWEPALTASV